MSEIERLAPGAIIAQDGDIELRAGRPRTQVHVRNSGDRPIQVGSHIHFYEVNDALEFDREAAFGMCLDIPSGTAIRFEPGMERPADLVAIGGARRIAGLRRRTERRLDETDR